MKYGYARTDRDQQSRELQIAALRGVMCVHIFEDRGQSPVTTRRPALRRCLKRLRAGDTLVIWKLDRLGRTLRDLVAILDALRARGVRFQSISEAINSTTPNGRIMWQTIEMLAEYERCLIGERTGTRMKDDGRKGVNFDINKKRVTAHKRMAKTIAVERVAVA